MVFTVGNRLSPLVATRVLREKAERKFILAQVALVCLLGFSVLSRNCSSLDDSSRENSTDLQVVSRFGPLNLRF